MLTSINTSTVEAEFADIQDKGVIWSAVLGGTVAASAILLMLAPLGSVLGFLHSSLWYGTDPAQKTFTIMGAIWLIIMQWISSAAGGYLTGRLRTGWVGAHTHEVFFRDTAHGFLTWALATILGVVVLAGGILHMQEKYNTYTNTPESYSVSQLFRTEQTAPTITEQDRADASMIFMQALEEGNISDADKAYLDQLVEVHTGLPPADAEKRVNDTFAHLKVSQKAISKVHTIAGIFIFLSMWVGAFIASAAGALGGQHRDLHYATGKLIP